MKTQPFDGCCVKRKFIEKRFPWHDEQSGIKASATVVKAAAAVHMLQVKVFAHQ